MLVGELQQSSVDGLPWSTAIIFDTFGQIGVVMVFKKWLAHVGKELFLPISPTGKELNIAA